MFDVKLVYVMLVTFQILSIIFLLLTILSSSLIFKDKTRSFGYVLTLLLTILSYLSFYFSQNSALMWYSYLFPAIHLLIVISSLLFAVNGVMRFYQFFYEIELLLSGFFIFNFAVWAIIFILDVITIGLESLPSDIELYVKILGTLIISVGVGNGIPVYLIAKQLFGKDQGVSQFSENVFILLYGISIGLNFSFVSSHPIIGLEPGQQFFLSTPYLGSPGMIISLFILLAPYFIFMLRVRSNRKFISNLNSNEKHINPYKTSQLKGLEIATYVYLLAMFFSFGLLIGPYYFPSLKLAGGLNQFLSTPFILILIIVFYLAFRSPQSFQSHIFTKKKLYRSILD